jgi:hypothetical protein
MFSNIRSERTAFIFGPVERPLALKQQGFDYGMHGLTIRLWRIDIEPTTQEVHLVDGTDHSSVHGTPDTARRLLVR